MESRVFARFRPPPKLKISEWADRYRMLSRESSAEAGRWSTDRTPYLREIMDAFTDPTVHRVVFRKCSRIGGTEAANNVVAYFIDQDPCPILMVHPTVDEAKGFSKDQLAPMIRDTPRLREKVKDPVSRETGNTIQSKSYPGGQLSLVGANAPTGFRRRTVRVVDFDEVDAYSKSAGQEGDQIELGVNRSTTYADPKAFLKSTPTTKGLSRIDAEYLESDQRVYHVACPDCGHGQALHWFPDKDGRGGMHWEGMDAPMYACEACGVLIPETAKRRMVAEGWWVPQNPGHPVRGYSINALYSPFPQAAWPTLVERWLSAQGKPEKLKVFYNTVLGESYEMPGGLDPSRLSERREAYPKPVPAGVGVLTMGIDVQADRIEAVVKGWGVGEESWLIDRIVLFGDTSGAEVWKRLSERWEAPYDCEVGGTMRVDSTAIDFGFNAEMVMRWARPRHGRKVYAVKGSSEPGKSIAPRRATVKMKHGGRGFQIGTDTAKDLIFARMKIGTPGPGYMHFPANDWCDPDYFAQLTSEKPVKELVRGVYRRRYVCPEGVRNEALDLEVYSVAAFALGGLRPEHLVAKQPEPATEPAKPEPKQETVVVLEPPKVIPMRLPKLPQRNSVKSWR